jgi:glycine/D-amino acid oxidase-like deaminating enzyme
VSGDDIRRDGYDAVVIGGGVAGCACAAALATRGLSVLLLERGRLADGASGRNQGGLLPNPHPAICGTYQEAIDFYKQVAAESRVPFQLRPQGYLLVGADRAGLATAVRHAGALAATGHVIERLDSAALVELEPGLAPDLAGGVRIEGAHAFHPVLATVAMAEYARARGAVIRTHTTVRGLLASNGRVHGVITDDGMIPAGAVVCAAGPWLRSLAYQAGAEVPVFGSTGYLVRTAVVRNVTFRHTIMQSTWHGTNTGLDRNTLPELRQAAENAEPFGTTKVVFSLQPLPGGEVVLGSSSGPAIAVEGATAGETQDAEVVARIARGAVRYAPVLAGVGVRASWHGIRPMTPDSMPIVGPAPGVDGLWVATGYGIDGMPLAPGTARMLANHLVSGRPDPDAVSFDPARFH